MLLVPFVALLLLRLISALPLSFPKRKLNPNKLTIIYGGPGSGKSTLLTLEVIRALKSGTPVYSNVPITGAYILDVDDLGKYKIPPGSLVVVDEIGSDLNNRDFAGNFKGTKVRTPDGQTVIIPSAALKWWKQHRHEEVEIICASQGFDDMDKKVQTLGSDYFIARKIPIPHFPIIVTREIRKKPDIDEVNHQPIDGFFYRLWGTHFCFGRFVWKYFDSFSKMELPSKVWHKYGEQKKAENQYSF